MEYQNPKPTEGINYSQEHPLKEFAVLVIGITLIVVSLIFVANSLAGSLASRVPFEFEKSMVAQFDVSTVNESTQQQYLQNLADRIVAHMDLPEGMTITVHYDNSDTVNALATLGGNLIFFDGLIKEMKSENELAAVMGHEIAHIKYRHPIVALGKGLTLASLAAFTSGTSGSAAGQWLIGSSANLTMMNFSREQESAADEAAAQMLHSYYGNIGGVKSLFELFSRVEGTAVDNSKVEAAGKLVEMFRSHPYSADRWSNLKSLARDNNWNLSGNLTPLEFPRDVPD